MATVNTNDLRIKNAKNLIDSFNGPSNEAQAYLFFGKSTAWADDNAPPTPTNNWKEFYTTYDDMLALKRINDVDALHVIPRVTWISGLVFDVYKQNYNSVNKAYSGASNLYDCNFFAINQQNNVYVCLDNNSNSKSLVEPMNAGNEPFYTSDGYQWLRLYKVSSSDITYHTTNNFIPITDNLVNTTPDGAVYTCFIDVPGLDYTTVPAGGPNQIPAYYANITGDGTGAVAKVSVSAGSITKIEVVRSGSGYTFAEIDFRANHVYASLADLDAVVNGLNPLGDGTFRSSVVIPPPGGWGTDLVRELGGTRVCVFTTLGDDGDVDLGGTFRQVGIIQDPILTGTDPETVAALYAVTATEGNAVYTPGVLLSQTVPNGIAKGTVGAWDQVTRVLKYTQ